MSAFKSNVFAEPGVYKPTEDATCALLRFEVKGWPEWTALPVILVQPSYPTVAACEQDASRPKAVATVKALLTKGNDGKYPLAAGFGDNRACLIVMPELTFGSSDWGDLDEAVRGYPNPLVLVSGFGWVTGRTLGQWRKHRETDDRGAPLLPLHETELDDDSVYNGGWMWIHRPNNTDCLCFLKNFPEQKGESHVPGMTGARDIVRVDIGGWALFPLICADILCQETDAPRFRVRKSLESDTCAPKHSALVGLCWESRPFNRNWAGSLGWILDQPCVELAVLANHATGGVNPSHDEDRWRSLTGSYYSGKIRGNAFRSHVRGLGTDGLLCGNVLRRTEALVAIGTAHRPSDSSPTTDIDPHRVKRLLRILDDGTLSREWLPRDCATYELSRFLRRIEPLQFVSAGVPAEALALGGLERLRGMVDESEEKASRALWRSLLHGHDHSRHTTSEDEAFNHDPKPNTTLSKGLILLGALTEAAHLKRSTALDQVGQLQHQDARFNALVWLSDDKSPLQMGRSLVDWARQNPSHPRLLVVGKGDGKYLPKGALSAIVPDIGAPQRDSRQSIDEPRECVVYWQPADDLIGLLKEDAPSVAKEIRSLIPPEFFHDPIPRTVR